MTISFVREYNFFLFQTGVQYDKVLLVLTDAASYMLKAMESLQVLFPKMLHLTCLSHGLHRVAEFVRTKFTEVNQLISKTKAIFVKVKKNRVDVLVCKIQNVKLNE